jgi:hypothetical protein
VTGPPFTTKDVPGRPCRYVVPWRPYSADATIIERDPPTGRRRTAMGSRGADLYRQDPAWFVEMMRYADGLQAGGVEYLEACARAVETFTRASDPS